MAGVVKSSSDRGPPLKMSAPSDCDQRAEAGFVLREGLSSKKVYLDQQFAQLKLVAMFKGLRHVGVEPSAVEPGTIGASLVFDHDISAAPEDTGVFPGDTILHRQVVSQVNFGEDILRGIAAAQPNRPCQRHFQLSSPEAFADEQPNHQWPGAGQIYIPGLDRRNFPQPCNTCHLYGVGFKLLLFQEICPAFGTVYGIGNVPGLADVTLNHSELPRLAYVILGTYFE
jgi:hypothetical protein